MATRREKHKEYLQTPEWYNLREFAIFRNWRENKGVIKCDDCGRKGIKGFDVHHNIYPDKYENDNPNFHVVLCRRCHGIRHNKIELAEHEKQKEKEYVTDQMSRLVEKLEELKKKKKR